MSTSGISNAGFSGSSDSSALNASSTASSSGAIERSFSEVLARFGFVAVVVAVVAIVDDDALVTKDDEDSVTGVTVFRFFKATLPVALREVSSICIIDDDETLETEEDIDEDEDEDEDEKAATEVRLMFGGNRSGPGTTCVMRSLTMD